MLLIDRVGRVCSAVVMLPVEKMKCENNIIAENVSNISHIRFL